MPLNFSKMTDFSLKTSSRLQLFKRASTIPMVLLVATTAWYSLSGSKSKLPPPSRLSLVRGPVEGDGIDTNVGNQVLNLMELGKNAIPVAGDATEEIPPREWISSAWESETDPVFSAFSKWAVEYIRADAAGRGTMESEGLGHAESRREKMAGLIAADPRQALANAVPADISGQLPVSVSALLERTVHGFGDLVTEYRCEEENSSSKTVVQMEGETYEASLYGSRRNLNYYLGSSIHGIVLDDRMAVLDSPLHVVKSAENEQNKVRFLVGNQEHSLPAGSSI